MNSAKRQHTMNTAIDLFAKKGFDNTSTQLIAKESGIGSGTLFKLFSCKEELIRQCYLSTKKEMIAVAKDGIDPTNSFEQILYKMWKNLLGWCLENPNKHLFTLQISASRHKDDEVESLVEHELLFFHMAVKSAQDKGDLVQGSIELVTSVMWSFLNLATQFSQTPELASEDQIFQLMKNSLKVNS